MRPQLSPPENRRIKYKEFSQDQALSLFFPRRLLYSMLGYTTFHRFWRTTKLKFSRCCNKCYGVDRKLPFAPINIVEIAIFICLYKILLTCSTNKSWTKRPLVQPIAIWKATFEIKEYSKICKEGNTLIFKDILKVFFEEEDGALSIKSSKLW